MTWVKLDDGFYDHPKVEGLSLAAVGLWTLCASYAGKHLSDGFVSDTRVQRLGGTDSLAGELIDAGLWDAVDDGIQFHDWAEYQFTRAAVEEKRASDRERQRRRRRDKGTGQYASTRESGRESGRESASESDREPTRESDRESQHESQHESHGVSRRDTHRDSQRESQGESQGESRGVSHHPVPSRPVPSRPNSPSESEGAPAPAVADAPAAPTAKGHRLPDGWEPRPEVIQQMASEAPHVDLRREHTKFTDYWTSQPGARGRKTDWNAVWRNWVRRAAEQAPRTGNRSTDRAVAGWQAMSRPTTHHQQELEP